MTAKEKAKELVDKFENIIPTIDEYYSYKEMIEKHFNESKKCALLAVDNILNEYWLHDTKRRDWWKEVKKEIEEL
jgi:hypothetical protein